MIESIIGICGTLLGTILGWILGRVDFGKLHISFNNTFHKFSTPGSMCHIPNVKSNEIYLYNIGTTMQLYNGANTNSIIRNIEFVFNDGKDDIMSIPASDDETRKYVAATTKYEKMEIANIPSHSGIDLKIHVCTGEIDSVLKTIKIYIQYKDKNLKPHRILLENVDYSKQSRFIEEDKIDE